MRFLEPILALIVYIIARIPGESTVAEGYIIILLFMILLRVNNIRDAVYTEGVKHGE